jgi:UDP-N-acetylmuramoyl-L-alanyl-D-glutamate--2,6-diaminopimelate ligase
VQVDNPRETLGIAAQCVFGEVPAETTFVGITGTNGKTTTAYLFQNLLGKLFGQSSAWMYGTIKYSAGQTEVPASRTTPESADIFRAIGSAAVKPKAVIMEVSSHALALDRIAGLCFDIAVWTNLTQDHLDFHHTMEEYYQAKKRLFTEYLAGQGCAVINIDDPWGKRLSGELAAVRQVTFGESADAHVRILSSESGADATHLSVSVDGAPVQLRSSLAGRFNAYNMAALTAGAHALSIDMEIVRESFSAMKTVPGRMQRVDLAADFSVFVDYAHTPDALDNVLASVRALTRERLLCVFGCGGDRDRTKRPLMGRAAALHCDEAIITSDNPRGEKPEDIIRDIVHGVPLDFPHVVIVDRREAIKAVLSRARSGDCIVIAGKGHESYQEIRGVRKHFDDAHAVRELFSEAKKNHEA